MTAPRHMRREDDIDLDYSERAGFLTGKAAAIADWRHRKEKREFQKLCDRLYAARRYHTLKAMGGEVWAETRRRAREANRKWRAKNRARVNAWERKRKAKLRTVRRVVCAVCGAEFITRALLRDPKRPRFCRRKCRNDWRRVGRSRVDFVSARRSATPTAQ